MHNWRRFASLAMVCFICSGVLCGGASAADVSLYSIVVGNSGTVSVPDLVYGIGTEPNISLGSVLVNTPSASYGTSVTISTGKQIDGVDAGRIVNINLGTVTQLCTVNTNSSSLSGTVTFRANLLRTSTGGVLSGTTVNPSSYTYSVRENNGGDSEVVSGSGSGSACTFDLTGLQGIYYVSIQWYFGIKSFTVPSDFVGSAVWPGFSTSTTVYTGSANDDVAREEEIIEGINQSNSLLGSIQSTISNVWTAITSLPSAIADAIKGLFVPTDVQIEELKTGFNNLLETKLGFVYQAASLVDGVVVAVFDACDNPDSDVAFTIPAFPAFEVAGDRVSLWDEPIMVDLSDNEVVSTIQMAASPFVVAVLVLAFAHSMENAFYAFVGGQTLIEWIRGRHEE